MSMKFSALEIEEVSGLIGDIYDCAIEPARWNATLAHMRDLLVCANATLYVFDARKGANRLQVVDGVPPDFQARMLDYDADIAAIYNHLGDLMARPLDRHFVLRRELSDEYLFANRYFMEWAQPQGISDLIQATLMREPDRLGLLAMGRYERHGRIGERELRLMDLLAPHLRRAVKISDIIDMKTVESATLGATLEGVVVPIVLIAADGTILHTNAAAQAFLTSSGVLAGAVGGRLRAADGATTERMLKRIGAQSAHGPASAGGPLVVSAAGGPVVVAHILPLSPGTMRARLMPDAAAAVFVTSTGPPRGTPLAAVSEAYGLTPAETRVLQHIAAGAGIAETAGLLGTAQTTTKTHLARILSKTGARRQADLITLVSRLTSIPLGHGSPNP